MNRTKRNLLLWAGIVAIIESVYELVIALIARFNLDLLFSTEFTKLLYQIAKGSFTLTDPLYTNFMFISDIINVIGGVAGACMLFYVIRQEGKYFESSKGIYIAAIIITIFSTSLIPWILIMISIFTPNIVVMNTPYELHKEDVFEQKRQDAENASIDRKKQEIEELKKLRDAGIISDEEYKQKLMEIL